MPLLPVPTLNVNNFRRYKGDSSALPIELQDPNTGDPFNPTDWVLVFTVKRRANVPDQEALIQKISTVEGITVTNAAQGKITVQLLVPDFEHIYPERMYVFDVRAQSIEDPELVYTAAIGTIWFAATPTHEATLSVPTYTVSPAALINALNELLDNALEELEPLIEELIEDKADVDQLNVAKNLRRRTMPTVASLGSLVVGTNVESGEIVDVIAHTSGRKGGGQFYYDPTRAGENDYGTVINGWVRLYSGDLYAAWFGAMGNGTTNDTTAIQRAIDASTALGGGDIIFGDGVYPCHGLILKDFVHLRGTSDVRGTGRVNGMTGEITPIGACLKHDGTPGAHVITLAAYPTRTLSIGVHRMMIMGPGASILGRGINFGASVVFGSITECFVTNFAREGIYVGGGACRVEKNTVFYCVLGWASVSQFTGAMFIAGSDHYIAYNEVQTGTFRGRNYPGGLYGTVTSANRYAVAWFVSTVASWFDSNVGELSDIGWVIWGPTGVGAFGTDEKAYGAFSGTQFNNCRGDRNAAQGWFVTNNAVLQQFNKCYALSNGSGGGADGLYDNWLEGTGASTEQNQYNDCRSLGALDPFAPYKNRFGFRNESFAAVPSVYKNPYAQPNTFTTRAFSHFTTVYGAELTPWCPVPVYPDNTIAAGATDATPTVDGITCLRLGSGSAYTITDFDDGVNGQRIRVFSPTTGVVTIANSASLVTCTGANIKLLANEFRTFVRARGVWYEEGPKSFTSILSAYNVASVGAGAVLAVNYTATGALLGDVVEWVACSISKGGLFITGDITANALATIYFFNPTGSAIDLGVADYTIRYRRP